MAILIAVVLSVFYMVAIDMATAPTFEKYGQSRSELIARDIADLQFAIHDQRLTTASLSYNDVETARAEPGYEYLNINNRTTLINSDSTGSFLTLNGWRFWRTALWYENPKLPLGNTNYVLAANNTCGSGDLQTGLLWCGSVSSLWAKLETIDDYELIMQGESARLKRTITKLFRRYSSDSVFTDIVDGTTVSLPLAVGYTGNAISCQGVYLLDSVIPLTCDDLFNYWGQGILLSKRSKNSIALINRTSLYRYNQPVLLAEEAILE
ncbi:hypothetical protein LCGC14_0328040 [marine sediment metagenome]|uniref:Uncharacterized protein n=1 Tax=marine sediment metagenome TaxID=412755 RepID=A0A0F9TH79_9ZZZZ